MKDDWKNPDFVQAWETKIAASNPTRPEQIDILISIILDNYQPGSMVVDIGCGSGQVEELIFKKNSDLKIVGVDFARPMIDIAKKRLADYAGNFQIIEKDIAHLQASDLPKGEYREVFSCQALHEITNEEKLTLFKKIYDLLEPDGLFLVMDRIKVDYLIFQDPYKSIWDRLIKLVGQKNAKSYEQLYKSYQTKEDSPASEEEYLQIFRSSGFQATTLHLHLDRALMAAVKK